MLDSVAAMWNFGGYTSLGYWCDNFTLLHRLRFGCTLRDVSSHFQLQFHVAVVLLHLAPKDHLNSYRHLLSKQESFMPKTVIKPPLISPKTTPIKERQGCHLHRLEMF